MTSRPCLYRLSATALALAALAACSSPPAANSALDSAQSAYQQASDNPQLRLLAPEELRAASTSLERANAAWARRAPAAEVDTWVYLSRQQVAIAQETARRKSADQFVATSVSQREQMRLSARTREADTATRSAAVAQTQKVDAQREADAALKQADASQQQAQESRLRNSQLEAQLKELKANPTDRGMVIALGDVLFDSGRASLKPGAGTELTQLAAFLQRYPKRTLMIEGHTDSMGLPRSNEALSLARADAVRMDLVQHGIAAERISVRGLGEVSPVAGNDNAAGRQLNRRVEIILSDENGLPVVR